MSRTDLRPHRWKVPGEIPHKQYIAWSRARAQAHFRNEGWELTFAEFQQLWLGRWDQRGRHTDSYCLSRSDPDLGWIISNVECIPRL